MKRIALWLAVVFGGVNFADPSRAATVTYDANTGASGAQDGAGVGWNTSNVNFWDGAGNVAWPNTSSDEAIFGAGSDPAGTVAVGVVTTNKITFNTTGSGNYTLSGGTITLGGASPTITVAAGRNSTISAVVTGSNGLTKSGAGQLTLTNNANNYTGTTTVNQGLLIVANFSRLGGASSPVVLGTSSTSGILWYNGGAANYTRGLTINAGGGSLASGGNGAVTVNTGPIVANGTFTAAVFSHNMIISSVISGAGGLSVATYGGVGGTVTLSNANTFTGDTTTNVTNGKLKLTNASALQYSAFNASGPDLNLDVTGLAAPVFGGLKGSKDLSLAINGYSGVTSLTLQPQSGSASYSGVISNGSGAMSLTKNGAGTQVLSGANTYTGATIVNAGVLEIDTTGSLAATAPLTVAGGTLSLKNNLTTGTLQGSSGATIQLNSGKTLTVNQTLNGFYSGDITGAGNFEKFGTNGSAHLRLTGLLSYTGSTTIGGTGNSVLVLQSATTTLPPTTILTVNSGGQLDLTAGTGNKTVEIAGLLGTGDIYSYVSTGTLKINTAANTSYSYSGVIKPLSGGNVIVEKTGAGIQTLAAASTYSGTTTVSGGTLSLGTSGSLNNSAVLVQYGGTFSGSGSVKSLNVQVGGFHRPGNSPGITTVNGDYSMAGTLVIEIDGLAGPGLTGGHDQVVVNNDGDGSLITLSGTLSVVPVWGLSVNDAFTIIDNNGGSAVSGIFNGLSEGASFQGGRYFFTISYVGGAGNDVVLTVNEVIFVPEPATCLLVGGVLGIAGWRRRQRRTLR